MLCVGTVLTLFLYHLMKEEIEAKQFEHTFVVLGTNRAAEPHLTKQVEVLCVSPQPVSHGGFFCAMTATFLF